MVFESGWHDGFDRMAARWIGGQITPEIVICHDTASRLDRLSAARYLQDNSAGVSVHFVVERDGSVTQHVPIDKRANHAGRSSYHGRESCNYFSIGIEIVNPGKMTRRSPYVAVTWYGEEFKVKDYGIEEITTPQHGSGLWMPYTAEQIEAVDALLQELFAEVDTLTDVTTHWYVSPGRKVDTNPLFPLEDLRGRVMGHGDLVDDIVDEGSAPVEPDDRFGTFVETETPGDTLNMRRWPSFNPNVIAAIPHGTVVPVIREGTFDGRLWQRVSYGGQEGWIVARYAAPVLVREAG